jgi:hypothetical protein
MARGSKQVAVSWGFEIQKAINILLSDVSREKEKRNIEKSCCDSYRVISVKRQKVSYKLKKGKCVSFHLSGRLIALSRAILG